MSHSEPHILISQPTFYMRRRIAPARLNLALFFDDVNRRRCVAKATLVGLSRATTRRSVYSSSWSCEHPCWPKVQMRPCIATGREATSHPWRRAGYQPAHRRKHDYRPFSSLHACPPVWCSDARNSAAEPGALSNKHAWKHCVVTEVVPLSLGLRQEAGEARDTFVAVVEFP